MLKILEDHFLINLQIFFDGNIESTSGHLYGLGAPVAANANNFQDNVENSNSSWSGEQVRVTTLTPQPRVYQITEWTQHFDCILYLTLEKNFILCWRYWFSVAYLCSDKVRHINILVDSSGAKLDDKSRDRDVLPARQKFVKSPIWQLIDLLTPDYIDMSGIF